MYGPKGVGFLIVRDGVALEPLIHGGGQETNRVGLPIRSGTLAVPQIVGLGVACDIARLEMVEEGRRILFLRRRLHAGLDRLDPSLRLNGHPGDRLPGNLNVRFEATWGRGLPYTLSRIAVSSASACSISKAGRSAPSHVLRAMGQDDEQAGAAIRFGLGRFTTEAEIDFAIAHVSECIDDLLNLPI